MGKLHEDLREKFEWYSNWHNHPRHKHYHFLILIAVSITVFCGLMLKTTDVVLSLDNTEVSEKNEINSEQLTNKLLREISNYQNSEESNKTERLKEITNLIEQRKNSLKNDLRKSPEKTSLYILPESVLNKIPQEIRIMLEKRVTVSGKFSEDILENIENKNNKHLYYIEDTIKNKKYNLHFIKDKPEIKTGSVVKVNAVALDQDLMMSSSGGTDLQTISVSGAISPTGVQQILVILVNFSDNTSQPFTPDQVSGMIFTNPNSVNLYYQNNTHNKTSFYGEVTKQYFTLSNTASYYCTNYASLWTEAEAAATKAWYNVSGYAHRGFLMPAINGCSWGGISNVLGPRSSFQSFGNVYTPQLMVHELGHSIGLYHASTISCGSKSIDSYSNCSKKEYGENYDPMGYYNSFHSNSAHMSQSGWLETSNVQTISTNGTYKIEPIENQTSGVQILRIAKKDTGENYYISYRQPTGLDASITAGQTSGALIHIWGSSNTYLVDTSVGDNDFSNSSLTDGKSFIDSINGITINQTSHDASGATLQVSFNGPVCTKTQPTINISPTSQSAGSGNNLSYDVTVKNNDTSSCSSTTFNNTMFLPNGFAGTFSQTSLIIAPGSSVTTKASITSPVNQADGSYQFNVSTSNSADPTQANSAIGTYVVFADNTVPTVSIFSPLDYSTISGATINIGVSTNSPSGISKVEIYIDGILKLIDTSYPYSYKWGIKKVPSGSHIISAKAYSKNGLTNTSTITVYK